MLWSDASGKPNQKDSWAKPIPFLSFFGSFCLSIIWIFILPKTLVHIGYKGFYFYPAMQNVDIFVLPETSGNRLCWGATCQEYFRYRGIRKFFDKMFHEFAWWAQAAWWEDPALYYLHFSYCFFQMRLVTNNQSKNVISRGCNTFQ